MLTLRRFDLIRIEAHHPNGSLVVFPSGLYLRSVVGRVVSESKFEHLRAAILEFYPDAGSLPRLRARIDAINEAVLQGTTTMSEAGLARLKFLNERLEELQKSN